MKADYLLKSNAIFTSNEDRPFAGGVAVSGNRIAAVLRGDEVDQYEAETVLDYGDKMIMPGFVDAHDHYFFGAISASEYVCNEVADSTSEAEAVRIMKEHADAHPDHKRYVGVGWFPSTWNDAPLPTKESLDEVFPDRPVYMICADFHTFWMNSKALEEAGITADMKPRSGRVGVDENGEMNGLLFEPDAFLPAMNMVHDFEPEIFMQINEAFLAGIAQYGVTSLSEMAADPYVDKVHKKYQTMKQMDKEGRLNARLHIFTDLIGCEFDAANAWREEFSSEKFRVCGVKGFIDGATSTYSALLLEPYADRPDTCGLNVPNFPPEVMGEAVVKANAAGLPVRIHCSDEGSVRMALDFYQASREANGPHGLKNTVEHIETIHPDDIPRFKELDVIPSMQPLHLPLDVMEKPRRVGMERCRWEWAHRSLLDAGAKLAFGTDYPVVDFNPYPTLYAAMTRCNEDGTPASVNPEECITLAESLIAYTKDAAAAYSRDDIGVLEEGKLADIIVVNKNLFELTPEEINNCQTDMTMFDGNIIFERK